MDSKGKGKAKGKGIAGSDSGKRKRYNEDDFSGSRKRKNPGVLQFFEDAADVVDDDNFYDGLSDFENGIWSCPLFVVLHYRFHFRFLELSEMGLNL